ncbi:TetR/AcrR family transcriptional regulator [Flavobacterium sp. GT3R68]|uniref:TetR/AcrR family transcriptional regulator n=1 Tax=Flavobacterium sp. GT3R68 TaxID=2594437 RepID=UPI000F88A3B3|nr:TetR family transcriptional regulator [Flavobacterium sp. GT3R68]RTY91821.1 TetR/AcrR family transcriptional regulator [Flavobacterium sp. GSN2]TRW90161.1 TetR/AcrR family transcriptional regulator [Flavobacterium sp. GT3R68]
MSDFNDKQIHILQVAEKLFTEHGFDGTSIRDIAKEAKINIAMISYYFGSKEKLLEALIITRISDLRLQIENLFKEELTPFEKIDRLIELYITRLNKNRGMYQILHFEISTKKRDINFEAFNEVKKYNLVALQNIIDEGQAKGIFKKDITVELILPTIMGTYFHFHMNRTFYKELLNLRNDDDYNTYIHSTLIIHIQQTIKALLKYEA